MVGSSAGELWGLLLWLNKWKDSWFQVRLKEKQIISCMKRIYVCVCVCVCVCVYIYIFKKKRIGILMTVGWEAEKAMATHSSTLAWQIPWTEEPGRLQPMGSLGVGPDWATSLSLFTFMHWRRKWQPTTVFLPGESQGRGSLVGCSLWGCTESDRTEVT